MRATSSSVGLTNTPTISTRRLSAAAISAASCSSQRRGERGQKISPIAHAPACDAPAAASGSDVSPQNLIFGASGISTIVGPHGAAAASYCGAFTVRLPSFTLNVCT